MKKHGFTLAEVLITLTIIGVVAVLTLPALMTNTQEQQARTALGKMTSTLTNVAALSAAKDGVDYTGLTKASAIADLDKDTTDAPSLLNLIANNATINRSSDVINVEGTDQPLTGYDMRVLFNDNTSMFFKSTDANTTAGAIQADGLPRGYVVIFDTNGNKGPNQISSCGGAAISTIAGDDSNTCANKGDRFLKDRYLMVLRGTKVEPIGAASVFLMTGSTQTLADANKSGGKAVSSGGES